MIHTECGLLLYVTKTPITESDFIQYLKKLQHRGREAYGIASQSYTDFTISKNKGIVNIDNHTSIYSQLFSWSAYSHFYLGHTRYSTSGNKDDTDLIQPILIDTKPTDTENNNTTMNVNTNSPIIFAFNGNIRNEIWDSILKNILSSIKLNNPVFGLQNDDYNDTQKMKLYIEYLLSLGNDIETISKLILHNIKTSYCLIISTLDTTWVIRDSLGNRPLSINVKQNDPNFLIISSETTVIVPTDNSPLNQPWISVLPNNILKIEHSKDMPIEHNYISTIIHNETPNEQINKPSNDQINETPNDQINKPCIKSTQTDNTVSTVSTLQSNTVINDCDQKFCVFEKIYFMNSNSYLTDSNQSVKSYRYHLARLLIEQIYSNNKPLTLVNLLKKTEPLSIDYHNNIRNELQINNKHCINIEKSLKKLNTKFFLSRYTSTVKLVGVPETGLEYASAISSITKIPISPIIKKKKNYNLRTFICGNDEERYQACIDKYEIDVLSISGQKIVLVDDSIVRGNTINYLISYIKKFRPKEIHVLIPSPPVAYPCYYGVDIPTVQELAINKYDTIENIRKELDIDSLTYLDIETIKKNDTSICSHCFDGNDILDF